MELGVSGLLFYDIEIGSDKKIGIQLLGEVLNTSVVAHGKGCKVLEVFTGGEKVKGFTFSGT